MPQTRFVLRKAFEHKLKALVMVNKIDRRTRPDEVLNEVFDLFVDLGADDDQLEFPVVYGSGRDGWATTDPADTNDDLKPLFDLILEHVPTPEVDPEAPARFQAATLDHDDFLGRIAVGRVERGTLDVTKRYALGTPTGTSPLGPAEEALPLRGPRARPHRDRRPGRHRHRHRHRGPRHRRHPLPPRTRGPCAIELDEPTISMVFYVNNSPFAGQEGDYVTSRQILGRLERARRGTWRCGSPAPTRRTPTR